MGLFDSKSSTKQTATQTTFSAYGQGVNAGGAAFGAKIFQPGSNDWKKPAALLAVVAVAVLFFFRKRKRGRS